MVQKSEKKGQINNPQDIEAFFRAGYFASVTWLNEMPSNSGVAITQVVCKFMDKDGNNDNQAQFVNVGPGSNTTLTTVYQGCCKGYFMLTKVRDASGQEFNFANTAVVDAQHCGGNARIHIVPQTKYLIGTPSNAPIFRLIIEDL